MQDQQLSSEIKPAPGPPLWRALSCVVLAFGLLAGLPYLPGLPPLAGIILPTVLFLLVTLIVIHELSAYPLRPLTDVLALAACLGAWWLCGRPDPKHLGHLLPLLGATGSVLFLLACIFAGRLLALIVRERNLLLPVAVIAGLADIFTVFFGPTGQALEQAPKLVTKLSVAIPQVGSATGAAGGAGLAHIATAGLGDFIFMTLFLVGVARFRLREGATFWSIFIAVALAMGAVLLVPAVSALPLLPFIVLGFLLGNAGAFSLSAREKRDMAIVISFVCGLLVLAGWALRQQ